MPLKTQVRVIPLKEPPRKPVEYSQNGAFELGNIKVVGVKGDKGDKGDLPKKGVDYFTKSEVQEFLKASTPIKGKHFFDGEKGDKGDPGKDGKEVNEDRIVKNVLKQIPQAKDGQDGKDAKPLDIDKIKKELVALFEEVLNSKEPDKSVENLAAKLEGLRGEVRRNYGAHGGTTIEQAFQGTNPQLTSSDNITFTLTKGVQVAELSVIRGGGRLSSLNGDFTYTTVKGNPKHVATISLPANNPLNVAQGETLNIFAKT